MIDAAIWIAIAATSAVLLECPDRATEIPFTRLAELAVPYRGKLTRMSIDQAGPAVARLADRVAREACAEMEKDPR